MFSSHAVPLAYGVTDDVQAVEDPTSLQSLARTRPVGSSVQIFYHSETFLVKGCMSKIYKKPSCKIDQKTKLNSHFYFIQLCQFFGQSTELAVFIYSVPPPSAVLRVTAYNCNVPRIAAQQRIPHSHLDCKIYP